mmetsp:Transcript_28680/g.75335  ORF Transcript_28680/g.75335 Transcript_28680/m.75335 type:complete len:214 (-) Transcript_28680:2793-3434(-)
MGRRSSWRSRRRWRRCRGRHRGRCVARSGVELRAAVAIRVARVRVGCTMAAHGIVRADAEGTVARAPIVGAASWVRIAIVIGPPLAAGEAGSPHTLKQGTVVDVRRAIAFDSRIGRIDHDFGGLSIHDRQVQPSHCGVAAHILACELVRLDVRAAIGSRREGELVDHLRRQEIRHATVVVALKPAVVVDKVVDCSVVTALGFNAVAVCVASWA